MAPPAGTSQHHRHRNIVFHRTQQPHHRNSVSQTTRSRGCCRSISLHRTGLTGTSRPQLPVIFSSSSPPPPVVALRLCPRANKTSRETRNSSCRTRVLQVFRSRRIHRCLHARPWSSCPDSSPPSPQPRQQQHLPHRQSLLQSQRLATQRPATQRPLRPTPASPPSRHLPAMAHPPLLLPTQAQRPFLRPLAVVPATVR